MITEIDDDGRVQLPLNIRYRLDLNSGDQLAMDYLGDGTIILKKIDVHIIMSRSEMPAKASANR